MMETKKLSNFRNALRKLFSQTAKILSIKTVVQSADFYFAEKQALLEYDSALIIADQLQKDVGKTGFEIPAAQI